MTTTGGPVRHRKNSHCSYCGHRFDRTQPFPRACGACGSITYVNPTPVAVLLVPIGAGLLAVRRAIPPHVGKLALPGGFIDATETWQQAAARELREETGVELDPETVRDFWVVSAPDATLLVFGRTAPIAESALEARAVDGECSERVILTDPAELAFPLHAQAATRWFSERAQ